MRPVHPLLAVTMTALALCGASWAQDQAAGGQLDIQEINVHVPPWDEFQEEDWQGVYAETFKAVFEPLGIEMRVTFTPYEASIRNVQNKQADVAMSGYRNEFPGLLYPRWPQELESVIVVHRASTPYSSTRDFVGRKVAWLRGYGFNQHLPAGIDVQEVRTEVLGMRMLDRGAIDFFVDYEPTIVKAASEGGVAMDDLVLSAVPDLSKRVYPMFRDDQRGRAIMAIYEQRMAELHADGSLDALFRKHGYDGYPSPE